MSLSQFSIRWYALILLYLLLSSHITQAQSNSKIRLLGTASDFPNLGSLNTRPAVSPNGTWIAKTTRSGIFSIVEHGSGDVIFQTPIMSANPWVAFSRDQNMLVVLGTQAVQSNASDTEGESSFLRDSQSGTRSMQSVLYVFDRNRDRWAPRSETTLTIDTLLSAEVPPDFELPKSPRFYGFQFSPTGDKILIQGQECHVSFDLFRNEAISVYPNNGRINMAIPLTNNGVLLGIQGMTWDEDKEILSPIPETLKEHISGSQTIAASSIPDQWSFGKLETFSSVTNRTSRRCLTGYIHQADGRITTLDTPEDEGPYSFGTTGSFSPDGHLYVGTLKNTSSQQNLLLLWDCKTGEILSLAPFGEVLLSPTFLDSENLLVVSDSRHYLVSLSKFETDVARIGQALPDLLGSSYVSGRDDLLISKRGFLVDTNSGDFERFTTGTIDFSSAINGKSVVYLSNAENTKYEVSEYDVASKKTRKLTTVRSANQGLMNKLLFTLTHESTAERWPMTEMAVLAGKDTDSCHLLIFDSYKGVLFYRWDRASKRCELLMTAKRTPQATLGGFSAVISPDGESFAFVARDGLYLYCLSEGSKGTKVSSKTPDQIAFDSEGKSLVCFQSSREIGSQSELFVYEVENKELVYEESSKGLIFSVAREVPRCILANTDPTASVRILDTRAWTELWRHEEKSPANRMEVILSSDGKSCGFCLRDGRLEVWDLKALGAN